VRRHLARDGHRRRPAADRAHGHGGLTAGRVDQLQDDDHDDHHVVPVVERRVVVGDGLLGGEFLGHVRVVGRGVERRRNGLERHERFRLERRLRTDRRGRLAERRHWWRQLGLRLRVWHGERRHGPPLGTGTGAP
jgi:hypothetical protein